MDTKAFFELDFQASLFPLKTNLVVIQHHQQGLAEYIGKILSDKPEDAPYSFLAQTRVHAAKPRGHLRRTVVLDPVASYFIYDLALRNRAAFGSASSDTRLAFGYRFEGDQPLPVHKAYTAFNDQVELHRILLHSHMISFDIASYFNSIYHHDAVHWFESLPGVSATDVVAFGRFFREINKGRSIDFLPQGIYPAKMIGSEFLRFIEQSEAIKCAQTLRFMDDIYLFDDDEHVLQQDFQRIQELLGLRSLNVNPTKTVVDADIVPIREAVSSIQQELTNLTGETARRYLGSGGDDASSDDDQDEEDEAEAREKAQALGESKIDRLMELMVDPKAEESDVENILAILQARNGDVSSHIPRLLARFPSIVKQLYRLAGMASSKDALTDNLLSMMDANPALIEYQLFWIAVIAEDHLAGTKNFGKLVWKLYERSANHKIALAKVLEIPDQSFGLKEARTNILQSGASDWVAWAAAVGTRTLVKAERNYALKYFSKCSLMNKLIADGIEKI